MINIRLFALLTLLLAIPIAILKLPWLPATILAFLDALRELGASGTPGYMADRDARFLRLILALLLYASGIWAILGLSGTIFAISRACLFQKVSWVCAVIVGIGLPFFDASRIGPQTDRFYVFTVTQLPIIIVLTALIGLILSLRYSRIQMQA